MSLNDLEKTREIAKKSISEGFEELKCTANDIAELQADVTKLANVREDSILVDLLKPLEVTTKKLFLQKQLKLYLSIIYKIEEIMELQTYTISNVEELLKLYNLINCNSSLKNLTVYCANGIECISKQIIDNSKLKLKKQLQDIKWPFQFDSSNSTIKDNDFSKLTDSIVNLITIQLLFLSNNFEFNEIKKEEILWVGDVFLSSIKISFIYHFLGNKETNKIEKPEWYFTWLFGLLQNTIPFLSVKIQPIINIHFNTHNYFYYDISIHLIQFLIDLVHIKLNKDYSILELNSDLIYHTINESISFDRKINTTYNIINNTSTLSFLPLTVIQFFTNKSNYFDKWLSLEYSCMYFY